MALFTTFLLFSVACAMLAFNPARDPFPYRSWVAGGLFAAGALIPWIPGPAGVVAAHLPALLMPILPLAVFREAVWVWLDRMGEFGALLACLVPIAAVVGPVTLVLLLPPTAYVLAGIHALFWAGVLVSEGVGPNDYRRLSGSGSFEEA